MAYKENLDAELFLAKKMYEGDKHICLDIFTRSFALAPSNFKSDIGRARLYKRN